MVCGVWGGFFGEGGGRGEVLVRGKEEGEEGVNDNGGVAL